MIATGTNGGTAGGRDGRRPSSLAPLSYSVKRPGELTLPERREWSRLRAANPALYSPYFDPAYCDHVAALREDCYVIIAKRDTEIVGFLPYQSAGRFAAPIGAPMTDYHGVIKAANEPLCLHKMLKAAGLGVYNFGSLVGINADKIPPSMTLRGQHEAAVMDVSQGADAWREGRDGSYRRSLKSLRRRIRKSESEHGARRFIYNCKDKSVFDTLMQWKRAQFETTGKYDVLSSDWTLPLLKRLWEAPSHELHCDMHALYFGDTLVAVDFGLTDGDTYHSWIVAYDGDFAPYSPGIQLLEGLIDAAGDLGYAKIDLGAGTDGYKKNYSTDPIEVSSGFVAVQGAAGRFISIYGKAENFGERKLSDLPGKLRRRYTQIANCDPSFSGRAKAMAHAVLNQK